MWESESSQTKNGRFSEQMAYIECQILENLLVVELGVREDGQGGVLAEKVGEQRQNSGLSWVPMLAAGGLSAGSIWRQKA